MKNKPEIRSEVQFFTTKEVKKFGNSYVLVLSAEDIRILGIKAGDSVGFRIQSIKYSGGKKK